MYINSWFSEVALLHGRVHPVPLGVRQQTHLVGQASPNSPTGAMHLMSSSGNCSADPSTTFRRRVSRTSGDKHGYMHVRFFSSASVSHFVLHMSKK